MKELAKLTAVVVGVPALIFLCFFANFKVWRMKHPTAPTWTYFVSP